MARKQRFQPKSRRARGFRPLLENLETRLAPAVVHWNVDTSGFWDDVSNWDTGNVPAAGDDVIIDRPNANLTVTVRDHEAINTLQNSDTLNIASGGGLEVVSAGQLGGTLALGGDYLQVDAATTLTGTLAWSSGTVFTGGQGLTNAGNLALNNPNDVTLSGILFNNATVSQTGAGNLVINNTITNNATGLIDFQSDAGITGNGLVNNSGMIRKSAGTGVSRIGASAIENAYLNQLGGTLDAESGTLELDQLRTSVLETGGVWNAAAGATLDFEGNGGSGTYFAGSFTGSGAGTVQLNSGFFGIDSGGATFNFPAGLLQWTGGTFFANPLTNTGTITLAGGADKGFQNILNNNGTLVETGTGNLVDANTFNNLASGVIDIQSDAGITGNGLINNSGTIRKSAGSDVSRIGPSANADLYLNQLGGTLDAESGTLELDQLRTSLLETGGIWNAGASATLDFEGNGGSGTYFAGTFTGSGAGTVQLNSGFFGIDSGGATFNFPAGLLQWTGGTFFANPLTNTGSITLAGAAEKGFQNILNNNGTLVETGTGNLVDANLLNNNATGLIDIQSDDGITGSGSFNNSGLIRKSAGTGVSRIGPSPNQGIYFIQLGGTLDAESGTLLLDQLRTNVLETGGTWNAAAGATLDFAGNDPSGTFFGGTFTGSGAGTVELSSGSFGIDSGGATFDFPAGLLLWTGGTFFGTPMTNSGTITLAGGDDKGLDSVLNNTGTIIQTGTGSLVLAGGTINNQVTGTYDFQSDAQINGSGNLNNSGMLTKSAGTGTSEVGPPDPASGNSSLGFNNTGGTIDVQTGTIDIGAGGGFSTGGIFNASAGAVLQFTGNLAYTGAYTGAGAGQVDFAGGSLAPVDGGLAGASVTFNFPAGLFHWTGGEIEGGGSASVVGSNIAFTNLGFITLDGPNTKSIRRNTIINLGTIIDEGPGDLLLHGIGDFATSTIDNQYGATFELLGNPLIDELPGNKGVFINAGTLIRGNGTGAAEIDSSFNSTPSGSIQVESGQFDRLGDGGTFTGGSFGRGVWLPVLDFGSLGSFSMTGTYTGAGLGKINFEGGLSGGDDSDPTHLNFVPGYLQHYPVKSAAAVGE